MAAKANLRYHVVFVTKYRTKVLSGIENEVVKALKEAANNSSIHIEEIEVEDGDHVHMVIRSKPSKSPDEIVARLKSISHRILWKTEQKHLEKFYWNKQRLWSGGYWCSTVGQVSLDKVLNYVKKQQHIYQYGG